MERSARKTTALLSFLLGSTLASVPLSSATTFGPVPLSGQLDHSQYVVHGRITGQRVENERTTGRPHTYWTLVVSKQMKGSALPQEITLRQPGGEVGDVGYQVPGAARFSTGEEVVVMARDTTEGAAVKDVVGLSGGKYTVEENGKVLRHGLGGTLARADGSIMGLKDLEEFVERARSGRLSEEDRRIILKPARPSHTAHGDPSHQSGAKESAPLLAQGGAYENPSSLANPLQKSSPSPEESHEGHEGAQRWPWIAGIAVVLAGLGLLILSLTRR